MSDDNEIYLDKYTVASLSMLDKADANYTNKIESHDVFMNIPVPKCSGGANMPCPIMISELIGAATSKRILRVLFETEKRARHIIYYEKDWYSVVSLRTSDKADAN